MTFYGVHKIGGTPEGVGSHPLKGLSLTVHPSQPMLGMAPPKGERYDHRHRQTDS